jgi:hypothetical protein
MAWEHNGLFPTITNVAEMMDGTPFHNGIVQRADSRLIHPVPWQICYITQKELINHEANTGYHTRKTKNSVFI